MEISSAYVQLSVSDGTTMRAWVARPKEEGAYPALLVFQEAFGVNAHIRDIAGRFAREGFVAVAPELVGRHVKGFFVGHSVSDFSKDSHLNQPDFLCVPWCPLWSMPLGLSQPPAINKRVVVKRHAAIVLMGVEDSS